MKQLKNAICCIFDWMHGITAKSSENRVKVVTNITSPSSYTIITEYDNLSCGTDLDKYKYCKGEKKEELKNQIDELEEYLNSKGLCLNTYILRQIGLFLKYGWEGTVTVFVDNDELVKYTMKDVGNDIISVSAEADENYVKIVNNFSNQRQ